MKTPQARQKPAPAVRQPGVQGSKGHTVFVKPATDPVLRVSPDVARVAAQEKVRKIEKALEVMSDVEGPAVDALRAELKKAQGAAAVPALNVQIAQCESFISRSQRRLADLEKQRATEEELLLESQDQVGEVKVRGRGPHCTVCDNECRRRVRTVARSSGRPRQGVRSRKRRPTSEETSCEEDFVPMCVEDAVHWLKCRQQEMEDAHLSWQPVGRREVGFGDGQWGSPVADVDPTPVNVEQPHLSVVEDDFRRRRALDLLRGTSQWEGARESPTQWRQSRYGMRGLRIGEASHPGPWSSDNVGGSRSEEELLDQFQRDLMRGTRRRVRRRVVDTVSDSEMPTTVPASAAAVRRVVGGQSQPRTIFISSDEERQGSEVRSTIPASLENLRAEREPHASRLEDANREARPTAVDSTRSEDTSDVVDIPKRGWSRGFGTSK